MAASRAERAPDGLGRLSARLRSGRLTVPAAGDGFRRPARSRPEPIATPPPSWAAVPSDARSIVLDMVQSTNTPRRAARARAERASRSLGLAAAGGSSNSRSAATSGHRGLTVELLWGLYAEGLLTWRQACDLAFEAGRSAGHCP
jgi:hypothetical protein